MTTTEQERERVMIKAEEITALWGRKCKTFDVSCPCCQIWAMHEKIEELTDLVDGLQSDLDSAVKVAFSHGAKDWVRLNYPSDFERLS